MRALVLVLLAPAIAAQVDGAPAPRQRGALIDAVIATVNDSAIMLSTVQTAASGQIAAEFKRLGSAVPPARIQQIQQERLDEEIRRHQMAVSAKTFGPLTPEQIEQLLQDSFERDRQEAVRDLGSYNEYSRQLKRTNRTWPTHVREQRIDKLDKFAMELSVGRRLSKQTNLFVTPRMLRDAYEQMEDFFVHPAEARIVQVAFLGPDAKEQATKAAAAWRADDRLSERQLAAKFPSPTRAPQVIPAVDAADLNETFAALRAFALAGPENAVSDPIAFGDPEQPAWHVAKVVRFRAAADGRFEDPQVQQHLREACARRVYIEFREEAWRQARERTEVRRVFDHVR